MLLHFFDLLLGVQVEQLDDLSDQNPPALCHTKGVIIGVVKKWVWHFLHPL